MADTSQPTERIHRYEGPEATPLPFEVGDRVRFTGDYHWNGANTHGSVGQVTEVIRYPESIIAGGAIYMVQRTTTRGFPYGSKVPMTGPDLSPA